MIDANSPTGLALRAALCRDREALIAWSELSRRVTLVECDDPGVLVTLGAVYRNLFVDPIDGVTAADLEQIPQGGVIRGVYRRDQYVARLLDEIVAEAMALLDEAGVTGVVTGGIAGGAAARAPHPSIPTAIVVPRNDLALTLAALGRSRWKPLQTRHRRAPVRFAQPSMLERPFAGGRPARLVVCDRPTPLAPADFEQYLADDGSGFLPEVEMLAAALGGPTHHLTALPLRLIETAAIARQRAVEIERFVALAMRWGCVRMVTPVLIQLSQLSNTPERHWFGEQLPPPSLQRVHRSPDLTDNSFVRMIAQWRGLTRSESLFRSVAAAPELVRERADCDHLVQVPVAVLRRRYRS